MLSTNAINTSNTIRTWLNERIWLIDAMRPYGKLLWPLSFLYCAFTVRVRRARSKHRDTVKEVVDVRVRWLARQSLDLWRTSSLLLLSPSASVLAVSCFACTERKWYVGLAIYKLINILLQNSKDKITVGPKLIERCGRKVEKLVCRNSYNK